MAAEENILALFPEAVVVSSIVAAEIRHVRFVDDGLMRSWTHM